MTDDAIIAQITALLGQAHQRGSSAAVLGQAVARHLSNQHTRDSQIGTFVFSEAEEFYHAAHSETDHHAMPG